MTGSVSNDDPEGSVLSQPANTEDINAAENITALIFYIPERPELMIYVTAFQIK